MALNVLGGPLTFEAEIKAGQFDAVLNRIEQRIAGLTTTANKEASAIDNLVKRTIAGVSSFALVAGAGNFVADMVRIRGEFQQLEVAFNTMLGSKEKADALLKDVTEFAATTPFELKEVAGAAKQLLAFGISADAVKGTLRSLGDVAAGLGQPLGEIAYLFGTIKTQGVAMTIDVRQFAQRGIPIYEALAKVLGVATEKVGDFITAGKVGFPEIEKAFQSMTGEGSKFGGLMEAQSKTLAGLQSNLADSIQQMFNELGKNSEGVFADIIRGTTSLVQNYEKVIQVIKVVAITYGTYRAALIATQVIEKASIIIQNAHIAAMGRLTTLQKIQAIQTAVVSRVTAILNKTMLANPYILAATAIAGLVAAMVLLTDSTTAQEKAQERLNRENEQFESRTDNLKAKTDELVGIIQSETSTRLQQVLSFKELQQLYPGLLSNMTLYTFKTLSGEDAQRKFNTAIDELTVEDTVSRLKEAENAISRLKTELAESTTAATRAGTANRSALDIRDDLEVAEQHAKALKSQIDAIKEAQFEANSSPQQLIDHYTKIISQLGTQKTELEASVQKMKELGDASGGLKLQLETISLQNVISQLDLVTGKLQALQGTGANVVKDKAFFEKQKKDAQAIIDQTAITDKNFNTIKAEQTKKIREADESLKKYDTSLKNTNSSTDKANKLLAEQNRLIGDGKSLIDAIAEAKNRANETGLTDEALRIKNINDHYDDLIKNVDAYNKKVDEFNRKNPSKPVQKIGQTLINDLGDARQRELTNLNLKIDADLFKENLDKKRQLFEQFENAKLEIGLEKSKELFDKELEGFTSFQQLLQQEVNNLIPKFILGIQNVGDITKFETLMKAIKALDEKRAADDLERQKQNFAELLQSTVTFNIAKAAINKKYDDLEALLKADKTIVNKNEALKVLIDARKEEMDALKDALAQRLPEFRKLFGGIEQLSDSAAKKLIEDARKILDELVRTGKISEEFAAQIKAALNQAEDSLGSRFSDRTNAIASAFGTIANSVRGLNSELADTASKLQDALSIAASLADAFKQFGKNTKEGDIAGITSIVSAISTILRRIEDSFASLREAKAQVADFNTQLITGEQEYNALLRDRQRQQVLLNKTALEGLQAQKKLLQEQSAIAKKSFDDIFKQLQGESFIASQSVKNKKPGLLSGVIDILFPKKEVKSELQSLAGKTFEEIEKLFNTGQLTDKAKLLFEQLQKIKQEGVDIDALLEQNRINAQQLFTGTSETSIADTILEGFKQGKLGIADFAGTFEDLMRNAIFQALKFQALEAPLKTFFAEFATSAESDAVLTEDEIKLLKERFNSIITDAGEKFKELEKITNINLSGSGSASENSLTGAIKGMTEQTAQLLAGQMGGLRLTALDHLTVSRSQLESLTRIQVNTALASERLQLIYDRLFYYYETRGVKVL